MNHIVESYTNSKEENRLTTDNSRRIEFITTINALRELIPPKSTILDCAAGTGVYAFHFAERGHEVTALDLTPRHIDIINRELRYKNYNMATEVNDATDLSILEDESFDVVLCMGPFYHLVEKAKREQCLAECFRVLRRGGILVTSYISRFSVFPYAALSDKELLEPEFAKVLLETGVITHDDPFCFWTDSYYSTPDEMEAAYLEKDLEIIDHLATDGISPLLENKIDYLTDKEFKMWCDYHYSVCREKSILGSSSHGLIIGRKKVDVDEAQKLAAELILAEPNLHLVDSEVIAEQEV